MFAQKKKSTKQKAIMCISKQLKLTSQHLKELKKLVGLGLHHGHSNNTSHQLGKIQL
jgi:hypothetical protein